MKKHWAKWLACGALIATTFNISAKTYKWDMPNEYPGTSVQGQGDQYFSAKLKEFSQGDIEIVHHFGGALGFRSKDQLDAVADGAVILANTFVPPLGGVNPIFTLSSLPFLVSTPDDAKRLYEISKPYYNKHLAKYNQKLLYASPWPASGLWGKKAYTDMASIKNLKMRSYDINSSRVFRDAHANPVQLSWADIVPQLTTGGIDAVLTSVESGLSASFNDYTKFFTAIHYDSTINIVTMNLDMWEELSESHQQAIEKAAQSTEAFVWDNIHQVIAKNYETAASRGVTVITDPDPSFLAEMKKLAEPAIQAWVKSMGKDGEEIIQQYRQHTKAQ
ncbi:TRAP transporter substrate-binding protein [Paenalcaligenes sp.]|uniref:TRAP transporter substrate-binding protein n=1 Tax=Paenalcaligenes sp. TaxID=1966342 RepID=UPI00260774CC|nr:TRAP transporter substrate-binding protein [Paenalcaligenes sp.]